jgi:hypothetical protein
MFTTVTTIVVTLKRALEGAAAQKPNIATVPVPDILGIILKDILSTRKAAFGLADSLIAGAPVSSVISKRSTDISDFCPLAACQNTRNSSSRISRSNLQSNY